jgi:hypothetical protein
MAKRGRRKSRGGKDVLIDLARQLTEVERRRTELLRQIVSAAGHELSSSPRTGASGNGRRKRGRRKGFKMSAEARAKISAAQTKRWSKQKAAGK